MLQLLRIRNLAIIDELEVEPGPGLTVVTGQTGAGKSMLIGALKLVLGGPGSAHLVRTGEKKAEVEAVFDLSADPSGRARASAEGIELSDGELIVRRVVYDSGRTRAYVNGNLTTAGQLTRLARGLVDLSSQHQHHTLVDARSHLGYLDAFGRLDAERDAMAALHRRLAEALRARDQAQQALVERAEREALLTLQLRDVAELDPQPCELDELAHELEKLRHADLLVRTAGRAEALLYTKDRALCVQVARAVDPLHEIAPLDADLGELVERLEAARLELEEGARDLSRWAAGLDLDASRLQALEERHHAIRRVCRRHGGDLDALLVWRAEAEAELCTLSDAELRVDEAERAVAAVQVEALAAGQALRAQRTTRALDLGEAMTEQLHSLGMRQARVEVAVEPLLPDAGLDLGDAVLGPAGLDRVEFRIAPNPGEAPRPLAEVASGGELSRTLLALKTVLAGMGPVGLYVFDEVDTGVGGAVAEVIGQKLAQVARHHQVLCVTHQPQVSVYGDHHLHVHKEVERGRTFSRVRCLDDRDRLTEVARMLGGIEVGEAAHQAARALLVGARAS